jgi:hypothetical protein
MRSRRGWRGGRLWPSSLPCVPIHAAWALMGARGHSSSLWREAEAACAAYLISRQVSVSVPVSVWATLSVSVSVSVSATPHIHITLHRQNHSDRLPPRIRPRLRSPLPAALLSAPSQEARVRAFPPSLCLLPLPSNPCSNFYATFIPSFLVLVLVLALLLLLLLLSLLWPVPSRPIETSHHSHP